MVRVISQETYNETVQENIDEFSMSAEEAIDDAIKQFEAQGVDLSNIIKDLAISDDSDDILTCINKIADCVKAKEYESIIGLLVKLKSELDKDMARKIYAGKNRAYDTLLDVMQNWENDSLILRAALKTITSLMAGNPDLLDARGVSLQISMIEKLQSDMVTLQLLLRWIRECCIKHELNRQMIFNARILEKMKAMLLQENVPDSVIKEVCGVLRALTLDDDVRHEFGKAHEHAAAIARSTLTILTRLLFRFKSNKVVIGELMFTLASIIVRNEFCQDVEDAGGLQYLLDIMTNFTDEEKINCQALKLIKALAGNDDVKAHIITSGSAPLIVSAISRLRSSEAIVTAGFACISALTLRSPSNAGVFYDCGTTSIIVDAMKSHPTSINVLRQAAWAVRNMSVRNQEEAKEFVVYGIEDLLSNAMNIHRDGLDADIKAALRDLGLKVDLKEQWTGKGVKMSAGPE